MADRHLNIFHAYRHGSTTDAEHEIALEDNVTRALIITLRTSDSDLLTERFLSEFTGLGTQPPYEHDLQASPKTARGRCLVVIAGRPRIPESLPVPDAVIKKFQAQFKDNPRRLSNALSRLCTRVKEESLDGEVIQRELIQLLGLSDADGGKAALADTSQPFYLLRLTSGSRPDAWIASRDGRAFVFENKLYSEISDDQIRRHIRESFGEGLDPCYFLRSWGRVQRNRIPVVLWSWRDVYRFFSRFVDESQSAISLKAGYVVNQFLEYLEVIGMSEVKFNWDDVQTPDNELWMVHSRVEELGRELKESLGTYQMARQNRSGRYLGVNLFHDDFVGKKPYEVPHWSLAWEDGRLLLFITCEGKELVKKLVRRRDWLEAKITNALLKAQANHPLGLTLNVSEKLNFLAGGKSKNASVRSGFATFPLELYQSKESLALVVGQAFDSMNYLLYSDATKDKVVDAKTVNPNRPSTSITGVLSLNYGWNWLTLQKEGVRITDRVKEVAEKLSAYHNALVEACK